MMPTSSRIDRAPVTHRELVRVAARWLKRRGCNVVLTERGDRGAAERPDAIGWLRRPALHSIVVECKVSRADFRRDQHKVWRQGPKAMGCERWYVAPAGLLPLLALPPAWGLMEWTGRRLRCVRVAEPSRDARSLGAELAVLIGELNAYQAQGLTYLAGAARWGPRR
jgi:hypothetical protein